MAAAEAELAVRLGDAGDLSRLLTRLTDALSSPLAADCPATA